MSVISLRLPEDLEARLDKAARASGMSRSEFLRAALDNYLDSKKRNDYYAQVKKAAQKIAEQGLGPDWEDWEKLSDEALSIAEGGEAPEEKWWSD